MSHTWVAHPSPLETSGGCIHDVTSCRPYEEEESSERERERERERGRGRGREKEEEGEEERKRKRGLTLDGLFKNKV